MRRIREGNTEIERKNEKNKRRKTKSDWRNRKEGNTLLLLRRRLHPSKGKDRKEIEKGDRKNQQRKGREENQRRIRRERRKRRRQQRGEEGKKIKKKH